MTKIIWNTSECNHNALTSIILPTSVRVTAVESIIM
ncbi:MAG: hypothetical protein ACI9J5_003261, partial [Paraglaciecola sp.]